MANAIVQVKENKMEGLEQSMATTMEQLRWISTDLTISLDAESILRIRKAKSLRLRYW